MFMLRSSLAWFYEETFRWGRHTAGITQLGRMRKDKTTVSDLHTAINATENAFQTLSAIQHPCFPEKRHAVLCRSAGRWNSGLRLGTSAQRGTNRLPLHTVFPNTRTQSELANFSSPSVSNSA